MLKILFTLVILALAGFILFAGSALLAPGPRHLDIADRFWSGAGGRRLATARYRRGARGLLDVWAPEGTRSGDALPVVIFLHGGGWDSGSRGSYGFVGRALAAQGFVVVVPDYRLVPRARFPDFLRDNAAAVAWTVRHIAAHGGDPARIALMGHSAGAYNAAMLALDPQWLARAGVDADVVRGVAGLAGPYDFHPFTSEQARRAMGHVQPPQATQPIQFAHRVAPPMWLASGTDDTVVRPENSVRLVDALRRAGASADVRRFDGVDHAGILVALSRPFRDKAPVLAEAADFLRAVTGRRLAAGVKP